MNFVGKRDIDVVLEMDAAANAAQQAYVDGNVNDYFVCMRRMLAAVKEYKTRIEHNPNILESEKQMISRGYLRLRQEVENAKQRIPEPN